jgi:hypothetical protein
MVVPDVLLDAVKRLAQNLYINAPTLSQVSVLCMRPISTLLIVLTECVYCMRQAIIRHLAKAVSGVVAACSTLWSC